MRIHFAQESRVKHIAISALLVGFVSFTSAQAESEQLSVTFGAHSPDSTYKIGYEDYDLLLKQNVVDLGRSFRQKAKRIVARTGTRLKARRNLQTALEGNRFFFQNFKTAEKKQLLTTVRVSLETLPNELSLKEFNKNVQLAYWLNLYNVTLLENLVNVNAYTNMEDYLYGDDAFLDKKILTVGGKKLSLNNIQYDIVLPNYGNDSNVMYGFFQGVIGGPNLRNEAYTGANASSQLKENGQEFVNSNRGTLNNSGGTFRVSNIYQRNQNWFLDFNKDLKNHLLELVDANDRQQVRDAKEFKANIKDMSFANLNGGFQDFGERAVTGRAQMGSLKRQSISQYMSFASKGELQLFRDLMMNSHIQRPKVVRLKGTK
ncbi:MAG: DUF547 domain-containing protein [Kangiellaceae bacterium]|nr:DUF547 domain-containing protein [Kangiellaceae bacterium]